VGRRCVSRERAACRSPSSSLLSSPLLLLGERVRELQAPAAAPGAPAAAPRAGRPACRDRRARPVVFFSFWLVVSV
jgi:hypothetical protein